DLLNLGLERRDLAVHLAAQGLRNRVEDVAADYLAIENRRHRDAGRGTQQRDVLRLGLAAQRLKRVLAAEAKLLLDRTALQLVVVGSECRRQGVGQSIERERHALGKWLAASRGQLERAIPAIRIEIADVGPVLRARRGARDLCELRSRNMLAAGARC